MTPPGDNPIPVQPDVAGACAYARERLRHELAPSYTYHSLAHTENEVVPAAEHLAAAEGVPPADRSLLRTAAWFHDLGCIVQRQEHERLGVEIARAVLPRFGFSAEQVEIMAGLIMATRLPQTPRTRLEEILADADLDVLGREDFWQRNAELRHEWTNQQGPLSEADWYLNQVRFLENHRYFTAAARARRDERKAAHLRELRGRLAAALAAET